MNAWHGIAGVVLGSCGGHCSDAASHHRPAIHQATSITPPEVVAGGRRQRSPPEVAALRIRKAPPDRSHPQPNIPTALLVREWGTDRSYRQADTCVYCCEKAFKECNPSRGGTDRNGYNRVPLNLRAAGGFLNCPGDAQAIIEIITTCLTRTRNGNELRLRVGAGRRRSKWTTTQVPAIRDGGYLEGLLL